MVAIGHHYLDNSKSLSNNIHKKVHSEQKKVCSTKPDKNKHILSKM